MKAYLTTAAMTLLITTAQAQDIWTTIPVPVVPAHNRAPELPVFDIGSTYVGILPAPARYNGSIWPDPAIVRLPIAISTQQVVCIPNGSRTANCYAIVPFKG